MMKKISIKHLHFANNTWLRAIVFYRLELKMIQERLEEIAGNNTGHEVAIKVEYFQNQLIIHREQLDILEHEIHENEGAIANDLSDLPGFIDEHTVIRIVKLTDDYATEERMLNELRHLFNRFAAEWL